MKTYRQREKQGTKVADSSKGPDEAKIKVFPLHLSTVDLMCAKNGIHPIQLSGDYCLNLHCSLLYDFSILVAFLYISEMGTM